MVLCRFFLSGSCRYGAKCYNDHIDIKTLIDNELKSSINGKQWPLSCFGPFKDKPSIPNFIEDQSFEEVRSACYEAKQAGNFEQFAMGFYAAVTEAKNKMSTTGIDFLNVCVQIYDAGGDEKEKPQNPSSIYGQSTFGGAMTTPATGGSSGGIFGGASSGASVFGGGGLAAQTNSSIFGGASQQTFGAAAQGSIFGNANATTTPSSIFGGATAPQSSIFGQAQPQQQSVGFGTFSLGQQQQQPENFSQSQPFSQPQPVQQQPGSNIFGNQGSMFGNAAATVQPPQTGSIFGQSSVFGQPPEQQQSPSVFSSVSLSNQQQMSSAIAPSSVFQQGQTQPANTHQTNNIFGHSVFAQQQQQQQQQSQLQMHENPMFGQAGQQPQQTLPNTNPFRTAEPEALPIYSKMEDLTEEQIQWFRAESFDLDQIPTVPPPKELC